MRRYSFTFFLVFFFCLIQVSAQTKSELKTKFLEAESYFLFEEYKECLPSYLSLLKAFPDNANYKYRIGICYLNTPGEKDKSIQYLELATQNINPKYREGSFRETGAPMDAYFFLGNAYRINNQLKKAIKTYQYFKENMNEKVYDVSVVDHQIESCQHAIKLEQTPVYLSYMNLGGEINTNRSEYSPVISGDGKSLVFTRALPFYDAVFYSKKVDGKWTNPINLTPELYVDRDFFSSSLSYDGKTLYLYKNDNYDGNIYVSHLKDDVWSTVEKLNNNINTKFWESHACTTKNQDTLYFTSNRKGTFGGLDIYYSVVDTAGQWGPAVNLGPNINTIYNEETPFITSDGQTLYFSSYGHYNMGGYDVFYASKFSNGEWSKPVNMGYPINTPDDDVFYVPLGKGFFAYYSQFAESGYGNRDIFRLEIFSKEHPRKFLIHGVVSLGLTPLKVEDAITIQVIESANRDTVHTLRPLPNGNFSFSVFAGEYDMNFEGEGFNTITKHLELLMSQPDSVYLAKTLMKVSDVTADLTLLDTLVDVHADTLNLHLNVESGSVLKVERYHDTTLSVSEEFVAIDSLFNYSFHPSVGDNTVRFTLTDRFGNTNSKELQFTVPEKVISSAGQLQVDHPGMEPIPDFIVSEELKTFRANLHHYATGDLKETIGSVDLKGERIENAESLVHILKELANEHAYTPKDVDDLLFLAASSKSFDKTGFINTLENNANVHLAKKLDVSDLHSSDFSNIDEVVTYLLGLVDQGVITREDLDKAITGMVLSEDPRLKAMRANLNSIAEGPLKDALEQLEPEQQNIYSSYELIDFLKDNAALLGYTEEELTLLLSKLAGNGNPDVTEFYNNLLSASEGALKAALENLNLKKEKISTIKELVHFLLKNADTYQYHNIDLMNALIKMISETDIDMTKVKELISAEAPKNEGAYGKYALAFGVLAGVLIFFFLYNRKKQKKSEP